MKEEDGSCNHIKCSFCGTDFCWLCLKEIGEFHYFRLVHYGTKSVYCFMDGFCAVAHLDVHSGESEHGLFVADGLSE